MIPLRATYRLQLNRDFTFEHALKLVPYLAELGVSHAYLSPVLMAQPGSTHGYDTVDHTRINPELGTLDDLRSLSDALKARGMGILLDFVPNHMGVGGAHNTLWLDVLKHGAASRYADWFDIDWQSGRPGVAGKLLVPFLGTSLHEAIASGAIELRWDGADFAVWAYDTHKLPVRPQDTAELLALHGSPHAAIAAYGTSQALLDLIATQHWRPAHFATAAAEINYRRFFVNSELAGISIDREDVLNHAHALIFSLIENGIVDGLRIDHVDGLRDPTGYLQTLRQRTPRPIHLFVEKILAPHEYIRADWPVDGTTGYEAGAQLTRLLTQPAGEEAVAALYESVVGPRPAQHEEAYRCKLRVMDNELLAELTRLARDTARLAWSVPATADLTQAGLQQAWREIIARLQVYRTYLDGGGDSRDHRELALAIGRARQSCPQLQPAHFDFLANVLESQADEYDSASVADLVLRFQQLTGPVMAKGLEDTALYRLNRLISLNEVGAHPDRFSTSIKAFHTSNLRRQHSHPQCLLATSTHDTKRGEDARLLVSSIADRPEPWTEFVAQVVNAGIGAALHRNDLYLLLQMLLGGWSIHRDNTGLQDRLSAALQKSLREGRERSDWGVPNVGYEAAAAAVVGAILTDEPTMQTFKSTWAIYADIARRKALIQTVLKLTMPGVPDIYRGSEHWEQSFVDPDNRRPLDFATLASRLAEPNPARDEKLILTQTLLKLRTRHPQLFDEGQYIPLTTAPATAVYERRTGHLALTVLVDLSPEHRQGCASYSPSGSTIAGGQFDPFWVVLGEA